MAERYIPEHRRTQFKAKSTFKPEELRRRREEQQVEIRKAKREENLAKRRGIGTGENRPGASLGAAPDSDDENPPSESQVRHFLPRCFGLNAACLILCRPSSLAPELQHRPDPTPLVPRRLLWSSIPVRPGPHLAPTPWDHPSQQAHHSIAAAIHHALSIVLVAMPDMYSHRTLT